MQCTLGFFVLFSSISFFLSLSSWGQLLVLVMVETICHICSLEDLPARINDDWMDKKRSTKRKPSTKCENKWISCDCCLEWCHPFCCGLQKEEFQKLESGKNDKKSGKSSVFFKCILCHLKAFDLSDAALNYKIKVLEKINSYEETSSSSTFETGTKEASQEELKPEALKNLDFGIQKDEEIREKIIIVDELEKPEEFRHSSKILKEIKKVSDQKIELAYPLSKGGIAIHTESKDSRDKLIELLSAGSFRGGKISTLYKFKKLTFFIKNVDTKVSVNEIDKKLQSLGLDNFECNRIINSYTQRPTKTVKVLINSAEESRFLNTKITVGGQDCIVERQQVSVIRCYACQQFGHIAKNCQAAPKCVVCAGSHRSDFSCGDPVRCGNCEGDHLSSDRKCPIFIKHYESLAKQHPKH